MDAIEKFISTTERNHIEEALFFVAQRGLQTGIDGFFNSLVLFLGNTFKMDYVLVSRLDEEAPEIAETVAFYAKGEIAANFRYALKDTPCENVLGQQLCVYRQGVQNQFPEDTMLIDMGVEGYIGTPLWDSSGQPIGLISMLSNNPLADIEPLSHVLQLVATRAAAELERERSDSLLRSREYEFRTLADNLPDNIVRYDKDGRAVYVNRMLEKTLGVPPEIRLGKSVREFFSDNSMENYAQVVDEALTTGKSSELEITLPTNVGNKIFNMRVLAERDETGEVSGVLAIGRDITQHKLDEEALLRLNRELHAISNCNQALMRAEDEQALLHDICHIVCEEAGYRMAWVGYVEHDDAKTIQPVAWAGFDGGYLREMQFTWADAEQGCGSYATAVREGKSVCVQDMSSQLETSPWRNTALQHGYRSSITLPLKDRSSSTFGVFGIFSAVPNAFTTDEVCLMEQLAADMAYGIMALRESIERHVAEQGLRESEEKFAAIFNSSPNLISLTRMSDGTIVEVNEGYTQLLGYSREESIGRTTDNMSIWGKKVDRDSFLSSLKRYGQIADFETTLRRRDGVSLTVIISAKTIKLQGIMYVLSVVHDITERKAAEEAIERLAFQDPLTMLPNRRLLLDRLHQALASGARSKRSGALIFIDLDNFKLLNDTLGHDAGDQLLLEVAKRLSSCVRNGDTISRFGGDEFMLMLDDLGENNLEVVAQIKVVGEKIMAILNRPYMIYGHLYHSSPSIGITLFYGNGTSVDELLKQADIAMYQAKSAGRNAMRFFDPDMQEALAERAAMEVSLRQAIREQQFVLFYQPQVDSERNIIGVEALVRWDHPDLGIVLPDQFIPLAEDTGLILAMGRWVLKTACDQLRMWADDPRTSGLDLAVNVSVRQFRQIDFVSQVRHALKESGAPPNRLKLELTESLLLEDMEGSIEKMRVMKELGVRFALDDFGTGYSSMTYLARLPLTQIKIDKSFIQKLPDNQNDAVIAQTIITMAKSLNMSVIAEGVETESQKQFLEQHGCSAYQGYLFSIPVTPVDFGSMLGKMLPQS